MDKILQYTIAPEHEGRTVAQFLQRQKISHRILTTLKHHPDGLTIGGEMVFTNYKLHAGETLRLFLREAETSDIVPQAGLPLAIIFENEDFFVIDKPAGMAVHPSQKNRENTVANALTAYCADRGEQLIFRTIGRLDKDPSGLLLVARNAIAAGILTEAAAKKEVYRKIDLFFVSLSSKKVPVQCNKSATPVFIK